MDSTAFDALTRHAADAVSRRASLLALGAAGIATAFSVPLSADARKNKKGKTAKQQCNEEKQQCTTAVQQFCQTLSSAERIQSCLDRVLPCCATSLTESTAC